jgi:uncharacterized damage-inducible protein DinB
MDLADLKAEMEDIGQRWSRLLEEDVNADAQVREVDPNDGYQRDAPMGIRLAAALHHGADHRSQISTALTLLGVKAPPLDPYRFGLEAGRVTEVAAPAR